MNVFEFMFLALTIIGGALGAQYHHILHVGTVLGGVVGTAAGALTGFVIVFLFAVVASLVTGHSLFQPKKNVDGT